jgi:hypothetical protein
MIFLELIENNLLYSQRPVLAKDSNLDVFLSNGRAADRKGYYWIYRADCGKDLNTAFPIILSKVGAN